MAAPLTAGPAHTDAELAHVLRIARPHSNLMGYYALASLLAGPFFFIPLQAPLLPGVGGAAPRSVPAGVADSRR